jgi:hypothetical protein
MATDRATAGSAGRGSARRASIRELEQRAGELEALLAAQERRAPILASHLAAALGDAVDEIQRGLTALDSPLVDYALQELEVESSVNLEVGEDRRLRIRFPGLHERVDPANLSRLKLRLVPIPKVSRCHGDG